MGSSARKPLDLIADYVEKRAELRTAEISEAEREAELEKLANSYFNAAQQLDNVFRDPQR